MAQNMRELLASFRILAFIIFSSSCDSYQTPEGPVINNTRRVIIRPVHMYDNLRSRIIVHTKISSSHIRVQYGVQRPP